jgi:hypothetical protein
MKLICFRTAASWILVFGCIGIARSTAAAPSSDINVPEKRRAVVELGARLSKIGKPAALPTDLVSPFNPPGFDLPNGEEPPAAGTVTTGKVPPPKTLNNRELVEQLAAKINPTGTMIVSGEPRLIFGKYIVKIGQQLTVNVTGRDYVLDIVGITSTTFTFRLNGEEFTRPIKPGKSP